MSRIPDPAEVIRIVREVAEAEILSRFCKLVAGEVTHKRSPRDLVTVADVAAERALAERLTALAPGSLVVGEEAAEADAGLLAALGGSAPVWLLDPVDGTTNYASGKPCFAVIVAWCEKGETRAGFIHDPIGGSVLWSVAGEGAWLEEAAGRSRVHAVPPRALADMQGSLTPRAADRLHGALAAQGGGPAPAIVRYGCAGREYMDLGRGVLDFAQYTRLKPWDHAAGVLIHREAGGFSALRRDRSPYQGQPYIVEETLLLAPNEAAWEALDGLLG
jgi:fructose-1,6-bisphosphatase/inositol monophosphatase family enzyme